MSLNGLVVMTPSSISYSGTSASISGDGSVVFSDITSYLQLDGVFTGDYDNYMVVSHAVDPYYESTLKFRLRSGGGDLASGYQVQYLQSGATASTGLMNSATAGFLGGVGNDTRVIGNRAYIFGPYLAQATITRVNSSYGGTNVSMRLFDSSTVHIDAYSCDGFTILPEVEGLSINGRIVVYGFNQ